MPCDKNLMGLLAKPILSGNTDPESIVIDMDNTNNAEKNSNPKR
jgi:hypothetical protein